MRISDGVQTCALPISGGGGAHAASRASATRTMVDWKRESGDIGKVMAGQKQRVNHRCGRRCGPLGSAPSNSLSRNAANVLSAAEIGRASCRERVCKYV